MIAPMHLAEAAVRFGGTLLNPDCRFTSVSIDSRKIQAGDLFVALVGERFDGHSFVNDVARQAAGLVVSTPSKNLQLSQWVVEDTTRALGELALLQREKFNGLLIALTGSCGKTSVKEMLASILRQCGTVHATQGNLNNHIGVPLTLLSLDADSQFAVLEMGASATGEIAYLCSVARPDIALVNNVRPAHVEGFGSVEAIAAAKGEIYSGLDRQGTAVINLDESWASQWRSLAGRRRVLTFSAYGLQADVTATNIQAVGEGRFSFTLRTTSGEQRVELPVPGRHAVSNALAAATCALAADADLSHIVAGLSAAAAVHGRLNVVKLPSGGRLIDDSYNANPGSVRAAVDVLAEFSGRRVLVLGDMAELGEEAPKMHREMGEYARQAGIDALYTLGELSAQASNAAGGRHFADIDSLNDALRSEAANEQITILVKGSRSARMERVAEKLMSGGER